MVDQTHTISRHTKECLTTTHESYHKPAVENAIVRGVSYEHISFCSRRYPQMVTCMHFSCRRWCYSLSLLDKHASTCFVSRRISRRENAHLHAHPTYLMRCKISVKEPGEFRTIRCCISSNLGSAGFFGFCFLRLRAFVFFPQGGLVHTSGRREGCSTRDVWCVSIWTLLRRCQIPPRGLIFLFVVVACPSIRWDGCVASTHATVCQQIVLAVASIHGTAYERTCTVPLGSLSSVRRTEGTAGRAVASSGNVLEASIVLRSSSDNFAREHASRRGGRMERRDSSAPFVPHLLFHRSISRPLFEPSPSPEEEQHPPCTARPSSTPSFRIASPFVSVPAEEYLDTPFLSSASHVRRVLGLVSGLVGHGCFVRRSPYVHEDERSRTRSTCCAIGNEANANETRRKWRRKEGKRAERRGGRRGGAGSRRDGLDGRDPHEQENGGGGGMREGKGTVLGDEGVAPAIRRMQEDVGEPRSWRWRSSGAHEPEPSRSDRTSFRSRLLGRCHREPERSPGFNGAFSHPRRRRARVHRRRKDIRRSIAVCKEKPSGPLSWFDCEPRLAWGQQTRILQRNKRREQQGA